MYIPLSNVLNCGLEYVSTINVKGLPEFEDHIVFVPLGNEGVASDRYTEGSSFKPDIALMRLATACDFRNVGAAMDLRVSQFVSKIPQTIIPKKIRRKKKPKEIAPTITPLAQITDPPQTVPTYRICWRDILFGVEVKRIPRKEQPTMEPPMSPNPTPPDSSGKILMFVYGYHCH